MISFPHEIIGPLLGAPMSRQPKRKCRSMSCTPGVNLQVHYPNAYFLLFSYPVNESEAMDSRILLELRLQVK